MIVGVNMALEHFYNIKEKKKSNIIDAIEKCMEQYNYDELVINDIVTAADISRGSFYNYFSDKNDAVETFVRERMKIVFEVFKMCINEQRGRLFDGVHEGYYKIKDILQNRIFAAILKNLKFFIEIGTKVIYDKKHEDELFDFLDWLIDNTVEGKTILNTREKMANVVDLFISLLSNIVLKLVMVDEPNIPNDGFEYKFNIIKQGVLGTY